MAKNVQMEWFSKRDAPKMSEQDKIELVLSTFTQTDGWYAVSDKLMATDGIIEMIRLCNANWISEYITENTDQLLNYSDFILWSVEKNDEGTFLRATSMNPKNLQELLYVQRIYKEFPLSYFRFYQQNRVLLLINEY